VHTWFEFKNLEERDHYEDLDVDMWIILKCILEKLEVGAVGIHLAQGRDWLWALVNMAMKLQVP
jgi:hypothetical protein